MLGFSLNLSTQSEGAQKGNLYITSRYLTVIKKLLLLAGER